MLVNRENGTWHHIVFIHGKKADAIRAGSKTGMDNDHIDPKELGGERYYNRYSTSVGADTILIDDPY